MSKTEYVLLLDDDNYVPSNILECISFLKNHCSIGSLGFGWIEYDGATRVEAADFEIVDNYLVKTVRYAKKMELHDSLLFVHPFDYVLTNALFKKEVFDNISWDSYYIAGGEHVDFYLNMKRNTKWSAAVCSSLYIFHDCSKLENKKFVKSERGEISKSESYFLRKWGLKDLVSWREMYIDCREYRKKTKERYLSTLNEIKNKSFKKDNMSYSKNKNRGLRDLYMERNKQRIEEQKNKHKGKRVFIIGTGPSLNKVDFSLLQNEILFGVNTLYRGFDTFKISPEYYACSDEYVWATHDWNLLKLDTTLFIAHSAENKYLSKLNEYVLLQKHNPVLIPSLGRMWEKQKFSTDLTKGTYNGHTIIIDVALQACWWMGFTKVYLLGCDCDYAGLHRFDGLKTENLLYGKIREDWSNIFNSYKICKNAFEADGREIINCTIGGKLEVFKRQQLEDVIK